MAVAVQLDFQGGTLDQYDEINEILGSLPGGPLREHELFHWAAKTEGGFRVVDVWTSEEAFEKFEAETLRPAFQDVGIPRGT